MTSLSEAAQYAIAQARERMAETRANHCRCGVPRSTIAETTSRPEPRETPMPEPCQSCPFAACDGCAYQPEETR